MALRCAEVITGFHPYQGPAGKRLFLREHDPYLSEVAAVLSGAKPVLYATCGPQDIGYLKLICSQLNLKLSVLPQVASPSMLDAGRITYLISKNAKKLKKAAAYAAAADKQGPRDKQLGYPDCCFSINNDIHAIYSKTRKRGRFSFLLNNVFNFYSRRDKVKPARHEDRLRRMMEMNSSLMLTSCFVIPWHPCSYQCRASLGLAKKIYTFMQAHTPSFAAKLKNILSRPVLYFNKFEFVVLKASRVGPEYVQYEGISAPFSLMKPGILNTIHNGAGIELSDHGVSVYDARGRRTRIKAEKPVLLTFSEAVKLE